MDEQKEELHGRIINAIATIDEGARLAPWNGGKKAYLLWDHELQSIRDALFETVLFLKGEIED